MEEPLAEHRESHAPVVTGPCLMAPLVLAFRWQTKCLKRSPMREQHCQRLAPKFPRSASRTCDLFRYWESQTLLATTREHHDSLRRRQVLPADAADFEEAALRACDLVLAGDARIGKVPGARPTSASKSEKPAEALKQSKASKTSAKRRTKGSEVRSNGLAVAICDCLISRLNRAAMVRLRNRKPDEVFQNEIFREN